MRPSPKVPSRDCTKCNTIRFIGISSLCPNRQRETETPTFDFCVVYAKHRQELGGTVAWRTGFSRGTGRCDLPPPISDVYSGDAAPNGRPEMPKGRPADRSRLAVSLTLGANPPNIDTIPTPSMITPDQRSPTRLENKPIKNNQIPTVWFDCDISLMNVSCGGSQEHCEEEGFCRNCEL
jgi:hypothetical protein